MGGRNSEASQGGAQAVRGQGASSKRRHRQGVVCVTPCIHSSVHAFGILTPHALLSPTAWPLLCNDKVEHAMCMW